MRIPVARYCFGALLWLPAIPVCNAADSASRYGEGIGINMAINVFREFWKLGH